MNRKLAATAILILALAALACGQINEVFSGITETLEATTLEAPEEATAVPGGKPTVPPPPPGPKGAIRQWAISAVASSEYEPSDWSAMQATGAPNTPECDDLPTAWASATTSGEEWLELTYETPVHPTEVRIVQSYNPGQIVKVELIDNVSNYHEIYTGEPELLDECPYTLSIEVPRVEYAVTGIRITIDQSVVLNWNEIDAVELVGVPAEE